MQRLALAAIVGVAVAWADTPPDLPVRGQQQCGNKRARERYRVGVFVRRHWW